MNTNRKRKLAWTQVIEHYRNSRFVIMYDKTDMFA